MKKRLNKTFISSPDETLFSAGMKAAGKWGLKQERPNKESEVAGCSFVNFPQGCINIVSYAWPIVYTDHILPVHTLNIKDTFRFKPT